jgi:tetratricopeptide (TPR) repeat protein/tRNA A-37 threonylcarbamoyl transferase component Bud32
MSADRNLLFGILALQNDFISRDQLVEAMNAWAIARHRPLGDLLTERGLGREEHDLLEALVNRQLAKHHGDAEKSLRAIELSSSACSALAAVPDADVQASLADLNTLSVNATTDDVRTTPPNATTDHVPRPGASAVRYRVLRPHARGGLGEVFVAEDTELRREVALKEIRLEHADSPGSRGRFLLEAEITGRLEHPGIVPVYGLGHYDDGRPFYAMRFIRGDNLKHAIDRFHASKQGFDTVAFRQVLRRFLDVCNAVAYAHDRGVLHRDLKPGNIMLGEYGETLLVDWGLAKVVGGAEPKAGEPTLRLPSGDAVATVAGSAVGTPAYMSPEQAEGRLEALGPATDVYSLGATLYCLLTGRAPVSGGALADVLEKVRRGDIPPAAQVRPDVPGALAAVCTKAMALRPGDRYPSAPALAQDVERWLADEPVSAHREGWGARLARWSRRHRAWVRGAAAALAVGLVAAVALAVQQTRAADREREIAGRERAANQLAQDRLVQVERGNGLLLSIFSDLDPRAEEKEGKPLRAILGDRIDRAVGQLEGESVGDPLAVAKLQDRLGVAQLNLGQFGRAIPLYRAALRTREEKLGPDHPDTLQTRSNLAESYRFDGRAPEAIALEEETLRLRAAKLGPDHPDTLQSRDNLAESYRAAGRLDKAIAMHEETLKLSAARLGPDHRETLKSRSNLGNAYLAAGRTAEATAMHEETLKLSAARLGPDFIDTLVSRLNLAAAYRIAGQAEKAIAMHEGTLKLSAAKLGPDHHIALVTRINLATAYRVAGRTAEAVAMNEETFKRSADKLGPDHPETLSSRNNLAESYRAAGRTAEAIAMHKETLELRAAKLGPDYPDTFQTRTNLAESYESLGRWADAEPLRREIVARRRKAGPPGSPALARDLSGLGRTLLHLQKWAEAESALRECSATLAKGPPDNWWRFHAMSLLGGALAGQRRYAEAEPLIVGGYEGLKARAAKIPGGAPPFLSEAAGRVVRLYEAWGRPKQAAAWKAKVG